VTNPIARRYATALFDVVRKIDGVERAEQDLAALKTLLASNPELESAFASAAIPPAKKRAVIDALFVDGDARTMIVLARGEKDRELRRAMLQKLSMMDSPDAVEFLNQQLEN